MGKAWAHAAQEEVAIEGYVLWLEVEMESSCG